MSDRFLPPERVIERTADIEGRAYFDGRAMTSIRVPLTPSEDDHRQARRRRVLFAWHDLHYNGRPDRWSERTLAFMRFVADRSDDDPLVDEVMRSEAARPPRQPRATPLRPAVPRGRASAARAIVGARVSQPQERAHAGRSGVAGQAVDQQGL
jgi:hypothetical protein